MSTEKKQKEEQVVAEKEATEKVKVEEVVKKEPDTKKQPVATTTVTPMKKVEAKNTTQKTNANSTGVVKKKVAPRTNMI